MATGNGPNARAPKTPTANLGAGGETHQTASAPEDRLTTNFGVPLSDDQNSLKAGPRGPSLLEDFVLREKIQHFDHERIPERIVHARGSAAHGYFELTKSLAKYTRAKVLTEGANGPTTPDAHKHLHDRGVFVIPDILANAGGVTTSYFEWVQDRYGYFWELDEVNTRLEQKMREAFDDVLQTSMKYKVDLRTAAYIVAISRVGNVTRMRGMYA